MSDAKTFRSLIAFFEKDNLSVAKLKYHNKNLVKETLKLGGKKLSKMTTIFYEVIF